MKLTLKQVRKTVLIISFGLVCGGIGWWLGNNSFKLQSASWRIGPINLPIRKVEVVNKAQVVNTVQPENLQDVDFSLFWRVWQRLEGRYLDKKALDPKKMVYGAIVGMTQALQDPYTVFLPPKENKTAKENLNGTFDGVGIRLGYKDGNKLVVMSPLEKMPAKAVGVRAGDLILKIGDKDTTGMSLPDAVDLIRGPKGTKIKLTLLHEEESEPYEVEIIRETIVVASVEVIFGKLEDGRWKIEEDLKNKSDLIAHLKLMRFGELTDKQWDESVEKIISKCQFSNKVGSKCRGIILDVRGNPGGYLNGSVNLASEFLASGIIVKQENADGSVENYSVNRKGRLLNVPLTVLIDQGSASASEILAGALKDYEKAKLVGEKTFGKGTIQEAEDLGDGAGLHVTTAKWLTPKGIWLDKEGLKPDEEVKNDPKDPVRDSQLEKAAEILLKN